MPPKDKSKRLYLIPVMLKGLDILELLQSEDRPMVLDEIHQQTNISKTTVYRILKTLVHRGYIAQSSDRHYRFIPCTRGKLCFGFGGQSAEMPFSQAVTASLRDAAVAVGVDLLVLDNEYDADIAIENAATFIREKVDIVIEFQVDEHAAPIIADKIAEAKIPMIAIDIPHPHATYFGVNNYRAGMEAGAMLADFAVGRWGGEVNWALGLDLEEAGQLVQSRITGSFEGIRARLPDLAVECFVRIDGRGMRDNSYRVILDFLKRHPRDHHILIAAANDTSALGAVEAARELGREKHVAIVGQDCVEEMLVEMQRPGSPAIATISHGVDEYGPRLIDLGLALLRGETLPPYNYVDHRAVTADAAGRMAQSLDPKRAPDKPGHALALSASVVVPSAASAAFRTSPVRGSRTIRSPRRP